MLDTRGQSERLVTRASTGDHAVRMSTVEDAPFSYERDQIDKLAAAAEHDRVLITQLLDTAAADAKTINNLEIALASSRRIGIAIGILMNSRKITDADAFSLLVAKSQDTNRKLRDIADDVGLTGSI